MIKKKKTGKGVTSHSCDVVRLSSKNFQMRRSWISLFLVEFDVLLHVAFNFYNGVLVVNVLHGLTFSLKLIRHLIARLILR